MEKDEESGQNDQSNRSGAWRTKIWALFDNPYSSISAKVIAVVSLFFILLSIAVFTLQTYPKVNPSQFLSDSNSSKTFHDSFRVDARALDAVELACSIWFVFEFVTRAVSCPSKRRFFVNVMNAVDLLALFPWFFRWCSGLYCTKSLGFLRVMRCVRVLRVFKLMRHVSGVTALNHALHASATTLCTVPLVLFICTLIFGTMAYYAESDRADSHMSNIPSCFWWAVITLTSVGYGDIVPVLVESKCVASLCAMVGVLLIVLPVPVIVNNFVKFNSLVKTKHSLPRKKKSCVDTGVSSSP